MKFKKILVTGGAGFVGTHLCRELISRGFTVRAFDNLDKQVHGTIKGRPKNLPPQVEWMKGDVTRPTDVAKALNGVDGVFHLAAAVGVGQSMYKIRYYVNANSMGGATVLEELVKRRTQIKKVVVASSMSIYGEGAYKCAFCGVSYPTTRLADHLKSRRWNFICAHCGREMESIPTAENKPLNPTSIYAVTKRDHEENFLAIGMAYNIPTTALRFFNIYGPEQALSNPYTGVAAIFSSRLLNGNAPMVFEDGHQTRDFIHVSDIVQGCMLALTKPEADYEVFNVGTGRPTSVLQMSELLAEHLGSKLKPELLQKFRAGDIRHCYADISKIKAKLGYSPRVELKSGISDLIEWVKRQTGKDRVGAAVSELKSFGLVQ